MSRFSETLLDHARSPRNGGPLPSASAVGKASLHGRAPYVTIYLDIQDGTISQAQFTAFGCGVTIASCSALTEMLVGRTLDDGRQARWRFAACQRRACRVHSACWQ